MSLQLGNVCKVLHHRKRSLARRGLTSLSVSYMIIMGGRWSQGRSIMLYIERQPRGKLTHNMFYQYQINYSELGQGNFHHGYMIEVNCLWAISEKMTNFSFLTIKMSKNTVFL